MKRFFVTILYLSLLFPSLWGAAKTVKIDKEHFPDENFRAFLCEWFNSVEGGEIEVTTSYFSHCWYFDFDRVINDFTGIHYFPQLTSVSFDNLPQKSIHIEGVKLRGISCNNCQLTSLNIPKD